MKNSFLTVSLVLILVFFFGFVLGLSFGELVRDRTTTERGGERSTAPATVAPSLPHNTSDSRTFQNHLPTDDAARKSAQDGATEKVPSPRSSEETREVSRSTPSDPLGVEEGFLASVGKFLGERLEMGTRKAVRFFPGNDP